MANPYRAYALSQLAGGIGAGMVADKKEREAMARENALLAKEDARNNRDFALRQWMAMQNIARQERQDQTAAADKTQARRDKLMGDLREMELTDTSMMPPELQKSFNEHMNSLRKELGQPEQPFTLRTPQPLPQRPLTPQDKLKMLGDVAQLGPSSTDSMMLNPKMYESLLGELGMSVPKPAPTTTGAPGMPRLPIDQIRDKMAGGRNDALSVFLPVNKATDPSRLTNSMIGLYRELRTAVTQNASPADISRIMGAINTLNMQLTGQSLSPEEMQANMSNMTAYQSGMLGLGQARIDETGRHNTVMEGIAATNAKTAKQNADTALIRAKQAVTNWQADRSKATGTAVVGEYGRLRSAVAKLYEAGYTKDSPEVKDYLTQMKEIEPAYRNALGLVNKPTNTTGKDLGWNRGQWQQFIRDARKNGYDNAAIQQYMTDHMWSASGAQGLIKATK